MCAILSFLVIERLFAFLIRACPTAVRVSFFWVEPGKKFISVLPWRKRYRLSGVIWAEYSGT